jgi:hypothetical protein
MLKKEIHPPECVISYGIGVCNFLGFGTEFSIQKGSFTHAIIYLNCAIDLQELVGVI